VTGADGSVACSIIETVNGYSYTPLSAIEAAKLVLASQHQPGFATPSHLFSASFAERIPGTRIVNLPVRRVQT
jgi:short subunit dehydrogenase-like uncharacterized protein